MSDTENKKPSIVEVPLGELGANLAMGEPDDSGVYVTRLSAKRWNLFTEQTLEGKRQQQKGKGGMSLHRYVNLLFSELCLNFGPYNFETSGEAEKAAILNRFTFADIMTAYTWLRKQCLGTDLKYKVTCPACGAAFVWVGDLDTLPIRTASKVEDTYWKHKVLEPFEFRKEQVEEIEFGPLRWASLANAKIEAGARKPQVLCSSVVKVNDKPTSVFEQEFREMGKRDLETILVDIDKHSIGPVMVLDIDCKDERCGHSFKKLIDWGYDDFFSVSSL